MTNLNCNKLVSEHTNQLF